MPGRFSPDLIVMTTHGRTGTRLWAYGSVAIRRSEKRPLFSHGRTRARGTPNRANISTGAVMARGRNVGCRAAGSAAGLHTSVNDLAGGVGRHNPHLLGQTEAEIVAPDDDDCRLMGHQADVALDGYSLTPLPRRWHGREPLGSFPLAGESAGVFTPLSVQLRVLLCYPAGKHPLPPSS